MRRGCGLIGLFLLAAAVVAAQPVLAQSPGYWRCVGGAWQAVGNPQSDAPDWDCGTPIVIPQTLDECQRAGGAWGPAGIFPQPICRMPTTDAGRACSDDGECQGSCLADLTEAQRRQVLNGQRVRALGQCTSAVQTFGCQARVEKGYVTAILCLD